MPRGHPLAGLSKIPWAGGTPPSCIYGTEAGLSVCQGKATTLHCPPQVPSHAPSGCMGGLWWCSTRDGMAAIEGTSLRQTPPYNLWRVTVSVVTCLGRSLSALPAWLDWEDHSCASCGWRKEGDFKSGCLMIMHLMNKQRGRDRGHPALLIPARHRHTGVSSPSSCLPILGALHIRYTGQLVVQI